MPEPQIDLNYEIIYEDDSIVIVNKSGNCPVHEGGLYKENCLTRILEKKLGYRVFPVYRIDRETSGSVVFAKDNSKVDEISKKLGQKEYISVCKGKIDSETIIDKPIGECKGDNINWKKCIDEGGKPAKTIIIPLKSGKEYSIIKAVPFTGRQHQIRVHLSSIGHPIVGDKIYEDDSVFKKYIEGKEIHGIAKRQALHLGSIEYDKKIIVSEIPDDIKEMIRKLF